MHPAQKDKQELKQFQLLLLVGLIHLHGNGGCMMTKGLKYLDREFIH